MTNSDTYDHRTLKTSFPIRTARISFKAVVEAAT
jgi:hypothetical protein